MLWFQFYIEEGKKFYQYEECGFHYENREWAEKCEAWCKEHSSCNIEITAHGLNPEARARRKEGACRRFAAAGGGLPKVRDFR